MGGNASISQTGATNSNIPRKDPDKLVMVDAYWIKKYGKESIKVRLLPHQREVGLYVEFVYAYDDKDHDKNTAPPFDIKFDIPGSLYDGNIKISVIPRLLKKWNPIKKYNGEFQQYKGKEVYYYVISRFTSDLCNIR